MSRAQLEAVVRALNARLPCRMRIRPEDDFWQNDDQDRIGECDDDDDGLSRMSEAEMKRRIEELVGIRPVVGKNRVSRLGLGLDTRTGVPPAPKAVRTRNAAWRPYEKTPWEMEVDATEDQTDDLSIMIEDALTGSSPLASRTMSGLHMRGRNSTIPRLAILQEENEGGESKEDDAEDSEIRPSKRQRVSLGSVTPDSEGGSQIVQKVGESRLIENMDLSGSPLLARDDAASTDNFTESDEGVVMTAINPECAAKMAEEGAPAPLQHRRSSRIKEISLKRTSSVDTGKKTTSGARESKSSILRSKTFTSRRSSRNSSTAPGDANTGRDSGTPREFTVRLPFTSTPPHQKPDSSAWSATRILRSHSQRLLNSSEPTKAKASLGRSQSERYPRASDLAFVTIHRPRYRFTQRNSKGTKVAKGDQASHPSTSASSANGACQPQRGIPGSAEHEEWGHKDEKENEDPKVATANLAISNLHTLPSALSSFLAPRSRAHSTSTVASTRGNNSPARTIVKDGIAPTAITDSVVSDGATERVWESLGRMVVDSL